jgi:hypothetical protein
MGAIIFAAAGILGGGAVFIYDRFFIDILSVSTIRNYAKGQAKGGSVYLPELYPSSMLDLLWYLPVQGFYFLFSPMPWDILRIGNILSVIAGVQSILLLVLVGLALYYRTNYIFNDWRIIALLMTVVLTAVGFGSITKNAGAAVRWRLPSTLLVLIITTNLLHRRGCNPTVASSETSTSI